MRRDHPALQSGKLWHLFSDDSAYVFLRQSGEDRILVVFNKAKESRTFSVPILDTPASGVSSGSLLHGQAQVEFSPRAFRLTAPGQSLSIFSIE